MPDKMKFETKDMAAGNAAKLAELFPSAVVEGKVNIDLLRAMLGEDVFADEAYEFTWVGKREAIAEAGRPIRKTLRPCVEESKDWDTTENLYIEGDNLDVLKLLQESYLGKVKMIYIEIITSRLIQFDFAFLSRYMYFNRPEFDRYARFNSWGSAREAFSWDDMCDITLDLPPLPVQQKYVNVHNAMLANQRAYEQGLEDLKLTCDAYND